MKRSFLFLMAFVLMTLAPLGAKGQDFTGLNVRQARNHANDNHSVQFTGYVNYIRTNNPTSTLYVQDNNVDGAGIHVIANNSLLTGVKVNTKIRVTANKVREYNGTVYVGFETSTVTNVEIISQNNTLSVFSTSLQMLKDQHYPATTQRVIADPFQHCLVRLDYLRVVGQLQNGNHSGWVVEDFYGVRDTINFYGVYPEPTLSVGQLYRSIVAVNCREATGYNGFRQLFVRSEDDIHPANEVGVSGARYYASIQNEEGTEVSVIGTVNFARYSSSSHRGEIYIQTPAHQVEKYAGLVLRTDFNPADKNITMGTKIIATGTPVICSNHPYYIYSDYYSPADHIFMTVTRSDVAVINQNDRVLYNITSLASLQRDANPTLNQLKNDENQHHLVQLSNLTVTQYYESRSYDDATYYYYGVSQTLGGSTVTDVLVSKGQRLTVGTVLPRVHIVDCRSDLLPQTSSYLTKSSHGYAPHLLLRSMDDIFFSTKSISYARTHLNETHFIEGVVSYVGDTRTYLRIQDGTGGMMVQFDASQDVAVGDRIVVQVYPRKNGGNIESLENSIILSTQNHDEVITPIDTDIATLLQINSNNPGPSNLQSKLVRLQNVTITHKGHVSETGEFYLTIQQNNQTAQVWLKGSYDLDSQSELDAVYNSIEVGSTTISSIIGINQWSSSTMDIRCRSLSDLGIAQPHSISISTYPNQVPGDIVVPSLSQYGASSYSVAAGQRVYLRYNSTTCNPDGITYLKPSNGNYNLTLKKTICTSHPDLELTQVNSTCWSFVMPNGNVHFTSVFAPNNNSRFSDVWEAREGAIQNPNDPLKLAYLSGKVTCIINEYGFYMEDMRNGNTGGDPLKKSNAIVVRSDSEDNRFDVEIGDLVYVEGYPVGCSDAERIVLESSVLEKIVGHSDVEQPYVTDLATVYNDILGSGQNQYNSRLQDRLVLLSDVHVDSWESAWENYNVYNVTQTVNNVTQTAALYAQNQIEIREGSTIAMKVINCTEPDETVPSLILRSTNDIPGANEITLGTNRVEFDEFGGTVSVPMTVGINLGGTPVIHTDNYNLTFTATMNNDYTAINITVPANSNTENRIGSVYVTVGEISSELLAVVQTGQAPATFSIYPSYQVIDAEDVASHNIKINNIKHVSTPYGSHVSTPTVTAMPAPNNFGTGWISIGSWDESTQSFPFSCLSENTDNAPRGVKVEITFTGTDGTTTTHEAVIYQNPPAAAMTVSPMEWNIDDAPKCVPVTQTITVDYENAFDQMSYNARHIWLTWEFGYDMFNSYDFNQEFSVEPEYIAVDPSGFGTATFTVTYMPDNELISDGMIYARLGEYDIENHEGIPGGTFSQQVRVWASVSNPYAGMVKVTSTDEIQSEAIMYTIGSSDFGMYLSTGSDYSGHIYGDLPSSQNSFYSLGYGLYCISLSGSEYMTWSEWDGLSIDNFDPYMDYPEDRFIWRISFDANGNALIQPFDDSDYYLSWNDNDEEGYFECVTEGGNPVQIYKENDGTLPEPTIAPETFWFMDGEVFNVTLTPAEGTMLHYGINGTPDTEAAEPVVLSIDETTSVSAGAELSCSGAYASEVVSRTYYKVNNIDDVRDAVGDGYNYSIKGIVTFSERNHLILQDETGAIHVQRPTGMGNASNYLYYQTNTTGNEMILTGTSVNTTAGISLDCAANGNLHEDLSMGNTVEPVEVTIAELSNGSHEYQSRLVKLSNVTVGEHVGAVAEGYYPLTQGNQTLRLRDTYEGEYFFDNLVAGSTVDVTAIFVEGEAWNCDLIIRGYDDIEQQIRLTVEGYGNTNDKWAFIASPVTDDITPFAVENIFSSDHDLYGFDQIEDTEWQNSKSEVFKLTNGRGFLYASKETVDLVFKGNFNAETSKTIDLAYNENQENAGWNLVGNPFAVPAYVNRSYYKMNATGTGVEVVSAYLTTPIAVGTGVMVQASGANETVTFSTSAAGKTVPSQGSMQVTLSQDGSFVDRAVVSFNTDDRLGKFSFGNASASICIPQGGKDYAVVNVSRDGVYTIPTEIPVSFKAEKSGSYTLNIEVKDTEMSYLHLIDTFTGADVDMLAEPTYAFEATAGDNALRFRLVFNAK